MNIPPALLQRLQALSALPVNYDAAALDLEDPPSGWTVDDRRQPLPAEPPGAPVSGGSFEIARQLVEAYKFADPAVVRAYYTTDEPFPGRDMLLVLRALRFVRIHVGVRVDKVYDDTRNLDGAPVRVAGWSYRTLEGHVEQGQMNWEVRKWTDTGEVDFHVRAVSRPASIGNPVVRLGFWLLRGRERGLFLDRTDRRMVRFTELGLRAEAERPDHA